MSDSATSFRPGDLVRDSAGFPAVVTASAGVLALVSYRVLLGAERGEEVHASRRVLVERLVARPISAFEIRWARKVEADLAAGAIR